MNTIHLRSITLKQYTLKWVITVSLTNISEVLTEILAPGIMYGLYKYRKENNNHNTTIPPKV